MATGRKRKPTALRVLEGNPSRRPLPTDEPKPVPRAPKRPGWLNKEARWLWNYLAPRLERVGLISEIDLPTFAILCQQFGVFAAAEKHLKKTGTRTAEYTNKAGATNVVEVAEAKIARNAAITFKSLASEFGLSPASRARLCGSPASRQEDELDELLKRAGL